MDDLKRWREERWVRRAFAAGRAALKERELMLAAAAPDSPREAAAPELRVEVGHRARRAWALDRWAWLWGPWFEPTRVSPVHPAWDDPTGRLLKRSLYASLGVNLILGPLILGLSHVRLPDPATQVTLRRPMLTFMAPPGNSLSGERSQAKPRPASPASATPAPPRAEPQPQPPRERAQDGHRVRETADTKETVVVAAKEKGNKKPGEGTTRVPPAKSTPPKPAPTPAPAAELPVTVPVAQPGPLVASVAGPVAGSAVTLGDIDGVNFPHSYYLEQIRDRIAQHWGPPVGISPGHRVDATIRFRILRDGQIVEQIIEVPSGISLFDQAALRAVAGARKFGPLPDDFPGEFLVVHFQFTYTSP